MVRFIRYGCVGALATAVHYGVLWIAVEWIGWPPWQGAGAGAVAGAVVAYLGNAWITFRQPAWHGARALAFLATAALGAACSMGVVATVVVLGGHYLAGQVLATAVSLVLTYAINRRWTFAAS